jgi:hypothetical protein
VRSAGRAAKALAKEGAYRAGAASRRVLARGVRSVAVGVQYAAHGVGDSAASALNTVADQVTPTAEK